jgi:uncharacterized membrane protein
MITGVGMTVGAFVDFALDVGDFEIAGLLFEFEFAILGL